MVQVTGRALPWAWLLVPVGGGDGDGVEGRASRRPCPARSRRCPRGRRCWRGSRRRRGSRPRRARSGRRCRVAGGAVGGDDLAPVPAAGGAHHPEAELAVGDGGVGGPGDRQGAALGVAAGACRGGDGDGVEGRASRRPCPARSRRCPRGRRGGAVVDEDAVAGCRRARSGHRRCRRSWRCRRRRRSCRRTRRWRGLTTQRLNWPSATAALVVQVTGRALPWAWLLVPVGAVTAMALKTARHVDRARREAVDAPGSPLLAR